MHLLRDHALEIAVAAADLEELNNTIHESGAASHVERLPLVLLDHEHLARSSSDLAALSSSIDSIVRNAFTISTEAPENDRFGSAEFQDLLHRVKDLGSAIAQWEFK
jgi:hypothetical protein